MATPIFTLWFQKNEDHRDRGTQGRTLPRLLPHDPAPLALRPNPRPPRLRPGDVARRQGRTGWLPQPKIPASHVFFLAVIADPDEVEDLAGAALSDALGELFSRLKSILDKHPAVTRKAPPIPDGRSTILHQNPGLSARNQVVCPSTTPGRPAQKHPKLHASQIAITPPQRPTPQPGDPMPSHGDDMGIRHLQKIGSCGAPFPTFPTFPPATIPQFAPSPSAHRRSKLLSSPLEIGHSMLDIGHSISTLTHRQLISQPTSPTL
jgi:hypothetical protein